MKLKNNLRSWREGASLSREQLAEKAGISAVSVFRIEAGSQQPRPELLEKFANIFQKPTFEFYAGGVGTSNVEPAPPDTRWIPVLDFVQAGAFAKMGPGGLEDYYDDSILTTLDPSLNAFAMVVRGRSMEPVFRDGDLVIVDPEVQPEPEDFVVAFDEERQGTFKQYRDAGLNEKGERAFELVPLNPSYPTWRSDRQKLSILGTMIEHRRLREPYQLQKK